MRLIIFLAFFTLFSFIISAQNGVSNWKKVAFDKTKDDSVRLKAIYELAFHFKEAIEYDSVIYYLDYGLSIAEKNKALSNNALELELRKGWVYIHQSRFYDAIESTRKLIERSKAVQNDDYISKGYLNLSSTYSLLEEYEEAQKYMDSLLELIKTLDVSNQVEVYGLQGQINIGKKNYKEALKNLFYAKNKTKTLNVYSAPIDLTLGECYLELNMLDSALFYAQTAYNKEIELSDKADAAILFAEILVRKNENDKGVGLLVESINLSKQLGDYYNLKEASHALLSLKDHLDGKIDLVELYEIYAEALDKTSAEEKTKEFYKNEYKRKVIEDEAKAKELRLISQFKQREEQKRMQTAQERKQIIIIVIFSFVLIGLFFIYRSRVKTAKHQLNLSLKEVEILKQKIAGRNFLENKSNVNSNNIILDRNAIESKCNSSLNDTDWKILTLLVDEPTMTNAQLAEAVFLSYEGVRSSLKRLYLAFDLSNTPGKNSLRMKLILSALSYSGGEYQAVNGT